LVRNISVAEGFRPYINPLVRLRRICLKLFRYDNALLFTALVGVASNFENDIEFRTFAFNTFDCYAAAHLLYNRFANAEAQTAASWVHFSVLFQVAEVHEQAGEFRFWDAAPEILHLKLKL
jgi:hypothetical protein